MKIGILTYHYSNNYGGVLQSYALYKAIKKSGLNVEIINFVPSSYRNSSILYETGLRKNIFKIDKKDLKLKLLLSRIYLKSKYNNIIISKFDSFRKEFIEMSKQVDEFEFLNILNDYDAIFVGSDQVWHPSQRSRKEYFLGYDNFKGKRISYAADSTISTISTISNDVKEKLKNELSNFDCISVRNQHSFEFVKTITSKCVPIVADPTLLIDFNEVTKSSNIVKKMSEKYILVYALGKEVIGTNQKVIDRIKEKYGNIKVYSIIIPTMKFNVPNYADEVLYDLGPIDWLNAFKNATFILTDSFHGTLFSMKFRKPFISYYAEKMRSTRFVDLGIRYGIEDFIINNFEDIDEKRSLTKLPDFDSIEKIINEQIQSSEDYLKKSLENFMSIPAIKNEKRCK